MEDDREMKANTKEIQDVSLYYADVAADYEHRAGYDDPEVKRARDDMKRRWQEWLRGKDVLEIACGTGYWTAAIAETARHVTAIDVNEGMLAVARQRLAAWSNIDLVLADAYSLNAVQGRFTAAFGHWWWSHIPKRRIRDFLESLHARLEPGAAVLFSDHSSRGYRTKARIIRNECGDRIEVRVLRDGSTHYVVKNFLRESEARGYLVGLATDITYRLCGAQWELSYRAKACRRD